MSEYRPWNAEQAFEVIFAMADLDGALLPILHALSKTFGYVPEEAAPLIAGVLNLSRAEIYGVLTFYHDFRRTPPPARQVKLCQGEACQARGSAALRVHAETELGARLAPHSEAGPRDLVLEPVYCLGLCASGPAAMIDGRPHARLTPDRFAALLAETA